MINLIANERFKNLGCKWVYGEWEAPKLAKDEANAIKKMFHEDLIAIEVTLTKDADFKGKDWGPQHVRMIGGYIVASASGRDSGARISEDVALISGKFTSGGSVKNYICVCSSEMTLRMEVSKNALEFLDKEVEEGRYTYRMLNPTIETDTLETLLEKKQSLLNQLKLLENEIVTLSGE